MTPTRNIFTIYEKIKTGFGNLNFPMEALGDKAEEAACAAQKLAALAFNLGEGSGSGSGIGGGDPKEQQKPLASLMKEYIRLLNEMRQAARQRRGPNGAAGGSEGFMIPLKIASEVDSTEHPDLVLARLLETLKEKELVRRCKRRILADAGRSLAEVFGLRSSVAGGLNSASPDTRRDAEPSSSKENYEALSDCYVDVD
jgi:hypothetical protein